MVADQGTDWAAWISAIATAFAALVVFGAALFAVVSLWEARRTRHGQLVTELNRQWSEPAILRSAKLHGQYTNAGITALNRKLWDPEEKEAATDEDRAAYAELAALPNLIEAIGVLMSEKALSAKVIYKMWGGGIMTAWNAWAEAVPLIRTHGTNLTHSPSSKTWL